MNYKTTGYLVAKIKEAAADANDPRHSLAKDLSKRFGSLETKFFDSVHSQVDVGLAIGEGSQPHQDGGEPHIMTVHGCRHVSDLIHSLDKIATYVDKTSPNHALDPEEAYILLCAAHVHDVGNIGGRKDHATKCGNIIKKHKELFAGTERREQVFDISRVHGGSDDDYGKDTFRSLDADNYQRPRLPLLAAILRMGDELSENPERVPEAVLEWYKASAESNLAYRYSQSFRRFELGQEQLRITLKIFPDQYNFSAKVKEKQKTFYEYLEERLNKLEMEMRYCSQYGRPYLSVRTIRVSIAYHEEEFPSRPTRTSSLTLELERGYPKELQPLTARCEELQDYHTLEDYCRGAGK